MGGENGEHWCIEGTPKASSRRRRLRRRRGPTARREKPSWTLRRSNTSTTLRRLRGSLLVDGHVESRDLGAQFHRHKPHEVAQDEAGVLARHARDHVRRGVIGRGAPPSRSHGHRTLEAALVADGQRTRPDDLPSLVLAGADLAGEDGHQAGWCDPRAAMQEYLHSW